jgi:violaxanthin de-epoxidase
LQQQAVLARTAAANTLKKEEKAVEKAFKSIEDKAVLFEKELVKDIVSVEKEIVKDVVNVEKEIVKDVEKVEAEIVKEEQKLFGR